MEILKEFSGKQLDAIFCCVGGGGLLAGVLAYVKQVRPDVKVFGVEAHDAAAMTQSIAAGHRVKLGQVGLFADGAAVSMVGERACPFPNRMPMTLCIFSSTVGKETFRIINNLVDGMITVSNDEVSKSLRMIELPT